jgi:hypothetical protein
MAINVFVSYSEKDHLAATLVGTLRSVPQVRTFIAHQVRSPGMSIRQKVNLAIEQAQVFLLLWSHRSESSEWVAYEVETALRLKKRVIPVLIEDVELPDALRDIEAVPLYRDSSHYMNLIAAQLVTMAAPAVRIGPVNLTWRSIAKAGFAAALGLAAAWSDTTEKPAEPSRQGRSPGRGKTARAPRRTSNSSSHKLSA